MTSIFTLPKVFVCSGWFKLFFSIVATVFPPFHALTTLDLDSEIRRLTIFRRHPLGLLLQDHCVKVIKFQQNMLRIYVNTGVKLHPHGNMNPIPAFASPSVSRIFLAAPPTCWKLCLWNLANNKVKATQRALANWLCLFHRTFQAFVFASIA